MGRPVDTSRFPAYGPDLDDPEEVLDLAELEARARACIMNFRSPPPIAELVLAFCLTPMLVVYLVRFEHPIERGEMAGETEMWVGVGDVPSLCFETDDARDPADAMRLYCAIAEDWAENVLAKRDLSDSYPIPVEPTRLHGQMLMSRVEFIREKLIPLAEGKEPEFDDDDEDEA